MESPFSFTSYMQAHDTVPYNPLFKKATKNTNAAILLQQMLYWATRKKKGYVVPFYKFSRPCDNFAYEEGTSWIEELEFTDSELTTALKKIAKRIVFKNYENPDGLPDAEFKKKVVDMEVASGEHFVYYTINRNRVTTYYVSITAINKLLHQHALDNPYIQDNHHDPGIPIENDGYPIVEMSINTTRGTAMMKLNTKDNKFYDADMNLLQFCDKRNVFIHPLDLSSNEDNQSLPNPNISLLGNEENGGLDIQKDQQKDNINIIPDDESQEENSNDNPSTGKKKSSKRKKSKKEKLSAEESAIRTAMRKAMAQMMHGHQILQNLSGDDITRINGEIKRMRDGSLSGMLFDVNDLRRWYLEEWGTRFFNQSKQPADWQLVTKFTDIRNGLTARRAKEEQLTDDSDIQFKTDTEEWKERILKNAPADFNPLY